MTAAVVVGAGPGPGTAIARRFGAAGFEIALVGRTPQTLEAVGAEPGCQGITVECPVADVTDRCPLVGAFDAITTRSGDVDVLEYSPSPPASTT